MKGPIFFLACRYLCSGRERFVPLLAGVTLLGCTLGIFFLTVVLSLMRGFQEELQDRWVGLNAHFTVTAPVGGMEAVQTWLSEVAQWPEIQSVNRILSGEVIAQTAGPEEGVPVAAKLKGIDSLPPDLLKKLNLYPVDLEDWTLLAGQELLAVIGLHPDFNEKVRLVYPFGEIGPAGDWVPRRIETRLSHGFRTGLYLWDAYTLILPYAQASQLLGKGGEAGFQIRLRDFSLLQRVEQKLRAAAPAGAAIASFAGQNERLFAALKLERIGMTLLLVLFLVIASFSMAGLLMMFLSAKRRDVAILRAIGFAKTEARKVFQTLGLLLGGLGTLLGLALGAGVCFYLRQHPVLLPPTYYLDYLPVGGGVSIYLGVLIFGLLLAWLVGLYPAHLVSRVEIVPQLRGE